MIRSSSNSACEGLAKQRLLVAYYLLLARFGMSSNVDGSFESIDMTSPVDDVPVSGVPQSSYMRLKGMVGNVWIIIVEHVPIAVVNVAGAEHAGGWKECFFFKLQVEVIQ